ncbi:uncharacterized protein Z518_08123 [Rhinocladiella mackenziei CBS 650.93]|uniref:Clr5 domain-containing protein n=1 Tax=Rhinocladiella mackenziei CBS 650.93 TaxID=1442369 RepID=A0A0D2I8J5_9EURO|nr:uncharacterized protein Z518_08123 [Rhinocladiella mackenziei CBS 650.93]KIX02184.1 hypothetical protein Z518_08123 [Rhinocladiella mackenziei CBS 650.93]
MDHPGPQPRTGFQRVQSKSTRNVIFGPFKNLIEQKYVIEGCPLKEIIEHIRTKYGVVQSPKQYKSQLKTWGFRHKLTLQDAAFILRLLNQAKARGLDEVVLFSTHPRRREDITKYIQRNVKLADENDLLSYISNDDETPHYIKLPDHPIEQPRATSSHLPPTPPSGDSSGSLDPPPGCAEVPPMKVPIPSPESSPRYPDVRSSHQGNGARWSTSTAASEPVFIDLDQTQEQLAAQETISGRQPAVPDIVGPFWPSQQRIDQSIWWPQRQDEESTTHWPADLTNALLSVTPAALGNLGFDMNRFGDHTLSQQLNDGSSSAQFVTYCLFWLICVGQDDDGLQKEAEYYQNSAMFSFLCMLKDLSSPGEDCLGALSVVTVLFDCYGQTQRLLDLLTKCDEVTKNHLGVHNPLTVTIAFKKNMLQRSGGSSPPHDIVQLRDIYLQMRSLFPKSPGPALTARYNLAWAMLENEMKKDVKDCEPARRELQELTAQFELHFGNDRIETIMAAATWARATFYCGDIEKAERILGHIVCPRVRKNFPEDHPYTWEAKHRQAFFLLQLAKKDRDNSAGRRWFQFQQAEQLLRQVVRDRHRILGESNPKSVQSFHLLWTVLQEQGKVDEANSLWEWCTSE